MKILKFLILFISTSAVAQNYIGITKTNVVVQQNNINYSNNNLGLSMIANEIFAFRNSWENRRKREEAISKAKSQLEIVLRTYENSKSYPQTIVDGWHLVMATDNYNYCSQAKVFIENNQIKEFVLGNWEKLSHQFNVLSPINNGKALLSLDFNGNTDTVELFFINDLVQPTTVDKPLSSGYISFWSDMGRASSVKIWFEKQYFGELGKKYDTQPECSDDGTITIEVKPGSYLYKAAGRGTISWEGYVEARENQCLSYNLNKDNKK